MMPNDDPGVAVAAEAYNITSDWTLRFLRMLLLAGALTAMIFSMLVLSSCDVVHYESAKRADASDFLKQLESIGPFQYGDSVGCKKISDLDISKEDFGAGLRGSRAGAVVAASFGLLALMLMLIEFLCCRFWCSRVIIVMILMTAALFQVFVFSLFGDEICTDKGKSPYLCELSTGGIECIVAVGLYILTGIIALLTPKARPLFQVMREVEKNSVVDPCCGCGGLCAKLFFCKICNKGRTVDEVLEKNPELADLIVRPDPEVEFNGVTYPQHFDTKAGVTLQDQYAIAYRNWIGSEDDYNKTVDRFKNECAELGISGWRTIKKSPPENIEDDELRRLVYLLESQREICKIAKAKSERFRSELVLLLESNEMEEMSISTAENSNENDKVVELSSINKIAPRKVQTAHTTVKMETASSPKDELASSKSGKDGVMEA